MAYTLDYGGSEINDRLACAKAAPIDSISAATTLTAVHQAHLLLVNGTYTITIASGLPVGMECEVMNYGSGTVTIAAASGVTLNGSSGGSKTVPSRYTSAVLKCVASNTWVIQGAIT